MKKATLVNNLNGARVDVYATTDHPDSSYGREVWVDEDNVAYMEVDCRFPNPFYSIVDVRED